MTDLFLSILGISVSGGLIVIVLMLLTPLLNKRYATKWKYFIWIVLALRLLIPFTGVNGPFIMDLLSQTKTMAISEQEEKNANMPADATMQRRIIVEIPEQMTTPINAQSEKNEAGITMLDIAAFVWAVGCLIFIFVHFISCFLYKRQVMKKGRIIEDAHIIMQMKKLRRELHIRRTVCVMEYCEAESPMIIGFLKPVLVLPKERYGTEELFFILKHELVHLKRGDVYLKLLFVTANAVHWFNPLIWMMQKEAVVDMELSCDERVIQGTSYELRKAYTETLLSMIHRRCARRTILTTQFYGGKKIMKKRFRNILKQNGKRNGVFILICAVLVTISFGTLVGCSIAKENKEDKEIEKEHDEPENTEQDDLGQEPDRTESMSEDHSEDEADEPENTKMLTFSKEGEQEQKQATLAIGDGYSVYLPDDERWYLTSSNVWTAGINEQVSLWATQFKGETMDSIDRKLESDGYVTDEEYHKWKQEGELICHVRLKAFENDVWGIFYSYPADFEEGWGRELSVIADTFAISVVKVPKESDRSDGAGDYLGEEECQEIKDMIYEFSTAYFNYDADGVRKFLADTFEGDVEVYDNTGETSDFTVKGLSDTDEKKIENGTCRASLEFRDSNYEDMFLYVSFILVKENDEWKIQSYGVEG